MIDKQLFDLLLCVQNIETLLGNLIIPSNN